MLGSFGSSEFGSNEFISRIEIEYEGIYQTLTNAITAFFNALATVNNFVVRYDNDPRENPTDKTWLAVRIDYGKANEADLGTDTLRVPGIFNVIIHIPIGQGIADALNIADVIAAGFRTTIVDTIINFQTPRIENVGRYEDNYLIVVICPFIVEEVSCCV